MSRMLKALRQIEAKSPQPPADVERAPPEEQEASGSHTSGASSAPDPPQAAEPVPGVDTTGPAAPAEKRGPVESGPSPEQKIDVLAETLAAEIDSEGCDGGASVPDVGRLLSSLDDAEQAQYRKLVENLLEQLPATGPQTVMFTSAGDGEGKTSTLASTAALLAKQVTGEILAVDGNLRNPSLANHFGIWADRGLAGVLTGMADWREVVRKTNVERLSVLPAGKPSIEERSRPEGEALASLLEALRPHYRFVLLDTASLLYPEVAPISKLCEGTYLVIELATTGRRAARQAVGVVRRSGGRVLGCVVRNAPAES